MRAPTRAKGWTEQFRIAIEDLVPGEDENWMDNLPNVFDNADWEW